MAECMLKMILESFFSISCKILHLIVQKIHGKCHKLTRFHFRKFPCQNMFRKFISKDVTNHFRKFPFENFIAHLQNLIVYIDDLLAHSSNHEDHRAILQLVFDRLRTTGLKANLKKCHFGSPTAAYLGFQLTPEGVLPGKDKLAAVRNSEPPTSVHQVRQFLGLVNFFRTHIRNFSMIASPLTQLTRKDTPWRGGASYPPTRNLRSTNSNKFCVRSPL
jgi:hypothetical protein